MASGPELLKPISDVACDRLCLDAVHARTRREARMTFFQDLFCFKPIPARNRSRHC